MNMSKIRKALVAGATTAGGVILTAVTTGAAPTSVEGIAGLIGAAVAAGVVAGWATWRTPNEK